MRCLLTGGNGFLGSWLVRRLSRADSGFSSVRCLVRPTADLSALPPSGWEKVEGDVNDPQSLGNAVEGVEVVFHLAGVRRAATRDEFMQTNATATALLAQAMVKAKARRLVLCSSLAASGPSQAGRPRVEDDPFSPEEWYGESKAEAERLAFGFSDRLEVTACRPSRIMGAGDHENLTFFKLVKRGISLKLLGDERRLSMVDVEDVAEQLWLQATKPEAVGQAFFSSSDESVTLEELFTTIAARLNVQPRIVPMPPWLLMGLGSTADVITRATGKKLPLNRKLARQLLAPGWTCSIEKAKRLLNYRPAVTLADSLERTTRFYLEKGWL